MVNVTLKVALCNHGFYRDTDMKTTSSFLLAVLVLGIAGVYGAVENSETNNVDKKTERAITDPAVEDIRQERPREPGQTRRERINSGRNEARGAAESGRREGGGRRREILVGSETSVGANPGSMLTLMFNDPEVSKELGLDAEERAKIEKVFAEADAKIKIKRSDLKKAAAEQARLITSRAPEDDVMKAVELVGGLRTDIAKLQTRKVIELRKHLTDEDIKKIDSVRRDRFRTRHPERRLNSDEASKTGEVRSAK